MTRRALIYCRQSDTREAGRDSLSLESQEMVLRERCADEGWSVIRVLREPDRQGWRDESERPEFAEALRAAEAGETDIILVWKLDRFARSVRIQEAAVYRLSRANVDLVSHTEPWANVTMLRQILSAVAEDLTRTTAANVRRAIRTRTARGIAWGVAPYGYVRPVPRGPLVVDPTTAAVVVEIFDRYAAGDGIAEITDDLTARGVPSPRGHRRWRGETVAAMLGNRAYLGEATVNGEITPAGHPAIVDPATFARVARRRAERVRKPRRKAVSSYLEGIIEHACGARMYLLPGHGLTRPFFACAHARRRDRDHDCQVPRPRLSAPMAEAAVSRALLADLAGALSVEEVVAAERRRLARVTPLAERQRTEAQDRLRRAQERRARAEDVYLSGARDRAWWDAQDAQIGTDIAAAERDLAAVPEVVPTATLRDAATLFADVRAAWEQSSPGARHALLRELGVVVVDEDGVRIRYRQPYNRFLRGRTIKPKREARASLAE